MNVRPAAQHAAVTGLAEAALVAAIRALRAPVKPGVNGNDLHDLLSFEPQSLQFSHS
jgi:hypothetical protein